MTYPNERDIPGDALEILTQKGLRKCVDYLADSLNTTQDFLSLTLAETWLLENYVPTGPRDLDVMDLLAGNHFTRSENMIRRLQHAMRRADGVSHHLAWAQLHALVQPDLLTDYAGNVFVANTWAETPMHEDTKSLLRQGMKQVLEQPTYIENNGENSAYPAKPPTRPGGLPDPGGWALGWQKVGFPDGLLEFSPHATSLRS